MKIPAIRSKIGNRTYYVTRFTFQQVNDHIEKIDDELHKSKKLRDLIQRSITSNYLGIKDYILNQPERFFNSLVLAVYDDYPIWKELKVEFDQEEFYKVGFLEFPSHHKIFPVDGQHRVEGIKEALKERPELADEEIGALIIGHENDSDGMQSTRRLFTTLNRYAKPVSLDDIIALDEDDVVAIITRYLLEEYPLFQGNRIVIAKQKAIQDGDKVAFTSIITLYQINLEVLKSFYEKQYDERPTKKRIDDFLKYRRSDEEVQLFQKEVVKFWDDFIENYPVMKKYINVREENNPAEPYRNKTGGHLFFRPVGLLPFVQAIFEIERRRKSNYSIVLSQFQDYNFKIDSEPWVKILWNPNSKTMIMGSATLVKRILIYAFSPDLLTIKEKHSLAEALADKKGYDQKRIMESLKEIPIT